MKSITIAFGFLLVITGSAFAVDVIVTGDPGTGGITVSADVVEFAKVLYQDTNIVFGNDDWHVASSDYSTTDWEQLYGVKGDTTAGEATGLYESADGARIFVESNADLDIDIKCSGNMSYKDSGNFISEMETRFTIAGTCVGDKGMYLDGQWLDDGSGTAIPFDGLGGYAGDNGASPGDLLLGSQAFHPNQQCFPMDDGVGEQGADYTLEMNGPLRGTIQFLGRVKRTPLNVDWWATNPEPDDLAQAHLPDSAGTHTASINLTFTVHPMD